MADRLIEAGGRLYLRIVTTKDIGLTEAEAAALVPDGRDAPPDMSLGPDLVVTDRPRYLRVLPSKPGDLLEVVMLPREEDE